jgi:hypothetical protein
MWEAYLQAEDQANAAVRGEHLPQQRPLDYLSAVRWPILGPRCVGWENLAIRTHKESPSGDWAADWRAKIRLMQEPVYKKLWLVGTLESQRKMEGHQFNRAMGGMACWSQETSSQNKNLCCNDLNDMRIPMEN